MNIQSIPRPRHIRVLALDDDESMRDYIRATLTSLGMGCETVENLDTFSETLRRGDYDVASIDCVVNDVNIQDEALWLLKEGDPNIGKIVFSAYVGDPRITREAEFWGADYVIEKRAMNNEEYVRAVQEAARLSFFRRTENYLRTLGRWPPALGEGRSNELSDEREGMLYTEARDALTASFLAGEEDRVLLNLLKRRGALREFNSRRYVSLPFHAKLAELLGYAHVSQEELSQILEIDSVTAEQFLSYEEEPSLNDQTRQSVYWLASILDFFLRLANDEPDMMLGFCTAKNLYTESRNIPPWDSVGLLDYLTTNGAAGLEKSLRWVRSY